MSVPICRRRHRDACIAIPTTYYHPQPLGFCEILKIFSSDRYNETEDLMIELKKIALEDLITNQRIDLGFFDPPDNERRKYDNYGDNLPEAEYVAQLR